MTTLPKFKDTELLDQALTHRSFLNEMKKSSYSKKVESNERLEFLGDAIISFLTSTYLFETFPDFTEGDLTNLRSLLVRTESLSSVAKTLNLGKLLKLSKGEEESGGRVNIAILANTFEAFIGALFQDQGLPAVSKILQTYLFPKAKKLVAHQTLKDAKSLFQELVQEKKLPAPSYKILESKGPEHAKVFTCGVFVKNIMWGQGKGRTKQEAEQAAAKRAIEKFKKS